MNECEDYGNHVIKSHCDCREDAHDPGKNRLEDRQHKITNGDNNSPDKEGYHGNKQIKKFCADTNKRQTNECKLSCYEQFLLPKRTCLVCNSEGNLQGNYPQML